MKNITNHILVFTMMFLGSMGAWAQITPEQQSNGSWKFTMPNGNRLVNVTLKADADLAWKLGNQTMLPTEIVSGYVGFESRVTFPTLSNPHGLPVTYSSTNTNAANINATTGVITFVGAGTTTIKAAFAGDNDYAPDTVSYTLSVSFPYTLTLGVNDNTMGSVSLVDTPAHVLSTPTTGIFKVIPGTQVTVTAEPAAHHHLNSWSNISGTDLEQTFTMTKDSSITANFAIDQFTINVTVAEGQGSMGSVSGGNTYDYGTPCTLIATPATGYHFVSWTKGDNVVSTNASYSFTVTDDGDYTANFAINTYTLTLKSNPAHGNAGHLELDSLNHALPAGVVASGDTIYKYIVNHGTPVTINAIPAPHYHLASWSNTGGNDLQQEVTITQDMVITGVFAIDTFTLTLKTNDTAMGKVEVTNHSGNPAIVSHDPDANGTRTYKVNYGTEVIVKATPKACYHLASWSNGATVNQDDITHVTVTKDSTVTANFAANPVLTLDKTGEGIVGLITGSRTVLLDTVTNHFTAQDGDILTGTLDVVNHPVKISIADSATVTLYNATINGVSYFDGQEWAGITCLGDATIVLGGENTVKGFTSSYPGIFVPTSKTLTIQGSGVLNASSNGYAAGIGGGKYDELSCGNIVIADGTINAIGGYNAAGIGSGYYSTYGNISITGGTVTAYGGYQSAGIGSGHNYPLGCGNISISGGTVTAYGGHQSAGIGSGYSSTCGNISITGGTVTAYGGYQSAGIGSGYRSTCGNISITGGTVTAYGGYRSAGIGSSLLSSCGEIAISNTVTRVKAVKGLSSPNSIGAGLSGNCGTVTVNGTPGAISESPYIFNGNGTDGNSGSSMLYANVVDHHNGTYSIYPGTEVTVFATATGLNYLNSWSNGAVVNNITLDSQKLTITEKAALTANFAPYPVLTLAKTGEGTVTVEDAKNLVDLSMLTDDYIAQDGDILTGTLADSTKISIADKASVTLYNVNIHANGVIDAAGITCLGDATLILSGTNTVIGTCPSYPGIQVAKRQGAGEEYTLTIQGSGTLNASGSDNGAGIGGGRYTPCGNIVIEGGIVNATGGEYAAGIGSGYYSTCGTITITNDVTRVTAFWGGEAQCVGAGWYGTCGAITINGTMYWDGSNILNNGADFFNYAPFIYNGTGSGNSNHLTAIIDLGNGQFSVYPGTEVTVKATAAELNYLASWSNGVAVNKITAASQTLTITENTALTANFAPYPTLTLDKTGEGSVTVEGAQRIVNLALLTSDYIAKDGDILTGTLGANVKISIADSATVTLHNASINADGAWTTGNYAGITCLGDATIVLSGENTVKGFNQIYPGIHPAKRQGQGTEYTLTIQGNGSLNASSNGYGAGIGSGFYLLCGNIVITGGDITATGGSQAAGIGSGSGGSALCGAINITGGNITATGGSEAAGIGSGSNYASCGIISITGGNINATGGLYASGIGSGNSASCDSITISDDVTQVTAIKGSSSLNSIGRGAGSDMNCICGTVTIGGTVYWDNNDYAGTGSTYLTQSPLIYTGNGTGSTTGNGNDTPAITVIDLGNGQYSVYPGTEVTVKATPAEHNRLASWTPAHTLNEQDTAHVIVNETMTLTANFVLSSYDVTASVANTADVRGTVQIAYTDVDGHSQTTAAGATAQATAQHGSTSTLTATPATGYHFVKWTNTNGDSLSINNPLAVTSDVDTVLIAVFDTNSYTITYMDGETEANVDTFKYRQPITDYSLSREGWRFDGWNPAVPTLMPAENLTVYAQWYRICDSLQDYDDNHYASVNINNLCWMASNLRTTHFSDGRDIANLYEYASPMHPNAAENVALYGRLYDWYDAVDAYRPATRAAVQPTHIQGICPAGWRLPTEEDFDALDNTDLLSLRSTDYWVVNNGTNSTGFDMRGSGLYNLDHAQYEELLCKAYIWTATATSATEAHCREANYYCNTLINLICNKGNAYSVRCVKD